ncbi:hypothetical protein [Hoeflea sp.]|uniref:hypothetical protein n=1 Tax=Hoeflea sp. TaxID=1940281 RepID=UPI003A926776
MAIEYPFELVRIEDLDEKRLAAIGSTILSWNLADCMLPQLIWALAHIPLPSAELVTNDMPTVTRLTLARNCLFREYGDDPLCEYTLETLKLFDQCRIGRNSIAHAHSYYVGSGDIVYGGFSAKSGKGYLTLQSAPYTADEMSKLEAAISALINALFKLTAHFFGDDKSGISLPKISVIRSHLETLRSQQNAINKRALQPQPSPS